MPAPRNTQSKSAKKVKKSVSNASAFKKNKGEELELPSGNVCLVRRPGMESLMADGIFSDSLMPMMQSSIDAARTGKRKEVDEEALLKDPKALADVMSAYDRVTAKVVIKPEVTYHKVEIERNGRLVWEEIPLSQRDDEIVYTDEVDLEDKIFIFQFVVGGTDDLARFREEHGSRMAALSDGKDVVDTSE